MSLRAATTALTAATLLVSAGCADISSRFPPPKDPGPKRERASEQTPVSDLEEEERVFENRGELDLLISSLASEARDTERADAGPEASPAGSEDADAGARVPTAEQLWALDDEQCLARLERAGVSVREPELETPMVRTPVLLAGPVAGVEFRPRWPRPEAVNAVMDCRLVLALVAVAREAAARGASSILFYSTYRPLPPERRARKKHSQHRRALAIDIRWFEMADGETIDLMEDYERHPGEPPCEDEPETEAGRFLQELACRLHELKVFNVILTPNANKAHHSHFHFDITPEASWYIIR